MLMKSAVILLLAVSLTLGNLAREPKFFFVSSSTSTSMTTTVSNLGASFTCLILSSTAYVACKRRRRNLAIIDTDVANEISTSNIEATRVGRAIEAAPAVPVVEGSSVAEKGSDRAARFAWYYMTTTITSVSTSTSTSTTFTSTVSVSALICTPAQFQACGAK